MRTAKQHRTTNETDVEISLNLDGTGESQIDSGIKFLDHMLELFTRFSGYDLIISATGDGVDNHHVVEDIGIVFGTVFDQALGDKAGIRRFGESHTPMDETLARVVVDICGRANYSAVIPLTREMVGELETELIDEFFKAFVQNAKLSLHIDVLRGENNHHILEGVFKGLGRTLGEATTITDPNGKIPSTKGVL